MAIWSIRRATATRMFCSEMMELPPGTSVLFCDLLLIIPGEPRLARRWAPSQPWLPMVELFLGGENLVDVSLIGDEEPGVDIRWHG